MSAIHALVSFQAMWLTRLLKGKIQLPSEAAMRDDVRMQQRCVQLILNPVQVIHGWDHGRHLFDGLIIKQCWEFAALHSTS